MYTETQRDRAKRNIMEVSTVQRATIPKKQKKSGKENQRNKCKMSEKSGEKMKRDKREERK